MPLPVAEAWAAVDAVPDFSVLPAFWQYVLGLGFAIGCALSVFFGFKHKNQLPPPIKPEPAGIFFDSPTILNEVRALHSLANTESRALELAVRGLEKTILESATLTRHVVANELQKTCELIQEVQDMMRQQDQFQQTSRRTTEGNIIGKVDATIGNQHALAATIIQKLDAIATNVTRIDARMKRT